MTVPTGAVQSEWVMAPTSRTVCSTGPGAPGALLIEIATSPTPKDVSMLNWPGLKANGLGPDVGSSDRVTTSPVSTRLSTTRYVAGVSGFNNGSTSVSNIASVHIQQPDPGRLKPVEHHCGKTLHEQIAESRIRFRLRTQALGVD